MPLKIYIVEDEPLIVTNIRIVLNKNGYHIVGSTGNYAKAIREINTIKPDLVLLDIQIIGSGDGVELAHQLDLLEIKYLYLTSQSDPSTISRVSQTSPLGYIVKPFTEAGLISNIELAKTKIQDTKHEFLKIKVDGISIAINQSHIQYLKAFDNYCYIHTASKKHLVPHTLKHMSSLVNNENFIQCHRSYWININKIRGLQNGKVQIDDLEIPLGKTYRETIFSLLN